MQEKKGSKDKKPRRKIFNAKNAANLAATAGLAVAGARLYKNRKSLSLKKNAQQTYKELLPATKMGVSKSLTKDVARNMGRDRVIDKAEKLVRAPLLAGAGGAGLILAGDRLRSRKKENYSRINTNTGDNNQIMFIGQIEQEGSSYNFARKRGSKDRKKRQRRSMLGTAAKLAGGAAAAGAVGYAGIKNRKAIGAGLGKAGGFAKKQAGAAGGFAKDVAMVGEMKARQMGRKSMSAGRSAVGKAKSMGSSAADRVGGAVAGARSAVAGGKAELNKRVMRKLPKNQRPQ